MDPRLQRARHLLDIDRPADAAEMLIAHLGDFPEDAEALGLLSLAMLADGRVDAAIERGEAAVAAAPDALFSWLALGHALHRASRGRKALEVAQRAVEVAPDDSRAHGLLAVVHAAAKRWSEALAAADAGLACDPEDDQCVNTRALALRQLGRRVEADAAIQGQLRRTPGDALTHANQGWVALQGGERHRAREHFREALRLDPSLEWARTGLRETLLAGHWFYRPVLRWFLWMERFGVRKQFAILIAGYATYRFAVGRLREADDGLQWLWIALIAVYLLFVVLTWFAGPIAAGLLQLSTDGRRVLTPRERYGALTICGMLAAGAAMTATGGLGLAAPFWLFAGIATLLLAIPTQISFDQPSPRARAGMAGFTGLCVVLAAFLLVSKAQSGADAAALDRLLAESRELRAVAERHDAERREVFTELGLADALASARADAAARGALAEQVDTRLAAIRAEGPDGERKADALVERLRRLATDTQLVRASNAALEERFRDAGLDSRIGTLLPQQHREKLLLAALGILCFWVSQFVSRALSARYPD